MDFAKLNPYIRTADIYEIIGNSGECISYDSRLFYMISGDLSYSIDNGKKKHLSTGNLLYVPAGTKYKLKGQYFRVCVISFDPTDEWSDKEERISPAAPEAFDTSWCHVTTLPHFDKPIFALDMESERDTFIKMANIAVSAEGEWRAEISAMLKLILLRLIETVSENALPARMVESLDSYIRENCGEEISNTEIGAIFGYHPFYVSRVLKEKKGITLCQYIISYRLKAAKAQLRTSRKSVAEIAEELGFTDASYFTKTFRSVFGMTPKEYRNSFKEDYV